MTPPPGAAVVVVSARLGAVLPTAAVRVLDGPPVLLADTDLPDELAEMFGAETVAESSARALLLTLDPATGAAARWAAAGVAVFETPEPPGARLLEAVAVMDRLRAPGGCPWDAEQTHQSLMPYLIEETYELYQALEDRDSDALREELGDVLLQVLFHARIAQEASDGFDLDAVATDLVTKLVGRHPHVFAGSEQVRTAADQERRWEELKRTEKRRESAVDGVALAQPALALAAKLVSRVTKVGLPPDLLPGADHQPGSRSDPGAVADPGAALFALAGAAKRTGLDPEAALRMVARRFADSVRVAQRAARAAGLDPETLSAAEWRQHWPD